MKKPLLTILSLLMIPTNILILQAARLKGTIVDQDGVPLSGVAFHVRNNGDENTDTIYYTDFEGHYDFMVNDGSYDFRLSKEGYNNFTFTTKVNRDFIGDVLTMTINEEENAKMLQEVKVMAKMLEQFTNRTEMYLSKENREFGINALDAVSSLPLFQSNINGSGLTNIAGTSVNILINGRRATPEELRNLTGYNIRKVVYYENAPAKFATIFSGPVINILLNTVSHVEFRGNLQTEANNSPGASGNIGATLLMPAHYLNGAFNIGGSNIHGTNNNETYTYPDLTNSFEMREGTLRSINTGTFLSYQWDRGPHMFFANFSYNSSSKKIFNPLDILESGTDGDIHGLREGMAHRTTDMMNLDLYYTYQFKGGQELSVDIVNAYNKSYSSKVLDQTMEEGSAYGDFHNDNTIHNNVYQLSASAMFSSPWLGGSFSCSLNEDYRRLSQHYTDNFFPDLPSNIRNEASRMRATVDYNRMFGRFGADLSLSLLWSEMKLSEGGKQHQVKPYPRLTLKYLATDNISFEIMSWVQSSQNSLGNMNINRYFIDTRYFGENLPYERNVFKYSVMFSSFISIPSVRLYIMPDVTYQYTRHPYVEYIYADGENFIKRSLTANCRNELSYGLGINWKPISRLEINPYFSGNYTAYRTPVAPVRFHWTSLRLNASYGVGNVQFTAGFTTPSKSMDGVQTIYSGWRANFYGVWQRLNWHVGLSYSFMEDDSWSLTEIPGFSHSTTSSLPRQGWRIGIFAGYSFKAGKDVRSRRKSKRLSNSASETGFSD